MKEQFAALMAKIQENKPLLIKVGVVLAGALVGAVVGTAIANAQQEYTFDESELLGLETDEETEDDETESEEE